MRYDIVLAPEAARQLRSLRAHVRGEVTDGIERHLRHEPDKLSRSRIKRLRGLAGPQYRLRVGEVRVFYDIEEDRVEILAGVSAGDRYAAQHQRGSRPKAEKAMRVSIAEVKDDLSRYLRVAEKEEVIITRHGQPAGVLIGCESEDDWFEYRLERDPKFLAQVSEARAALRRGEGIPLENIDA